MKTHNDIEMVDDLYDFLDGEEVLDLFTANCDCREIAGSIDNAFVWEDTKEGAAYWAALYGKSYMSCI